MDFSSRQLRAFHYVAEHKSFARVGERLLITPSGLSVLIRELKRQLGFRLFDRTTRQVTLTAYGRDLLAVTEPGSRHSTKRWRASSRQLRGGPVGSRSGRRLV